jgi:hypothetical protein
MRNCGYLGNKKLPSPQIAYVTVVTQQQTSPRQQEIT